MVVLRELNNLKKHGFNVISIFIIALNFTIGITSNANGASGSFDRDYYLPSLSDTTDFDRAWISVTDSTANATNTPDTIAVTIKSGFNSTNFVLKETGGTTNVFTSSGLMQPILNVEAGNNTGIFFSTSSSTSPWTREAVDAPRSFSHISSQAIAVDSNNHPHIAYGGDYLYYAYQDSSNWHYETVDLSGGSYASIALDTSGKVHISYWDGSGLKYATNASGSWATTTADWSGSIYDTSVAIDPSGNVHISYRVSQDSSHNTLKYASNTSGEWEITTVERSIPNSGIYSSSIAADSSGKGHITYNSGNDIKYATNASGVWIITSVDSEGDSSSIALDTSGNVHMSYSGTTLKYATNASVTWIITIVDSGYYKNNSIVVDTSGKAHISYSTGSELKYATNTSGSWSTNTLYIDSHHTSIHGDNSIALDTVDRVHICYQDGSNGELKYITNTSGSWVTTTVDHSESVGQYNSVALDKSGNVHVSYSSGWRFNDPKAVKYATNASDSWLTNTVDYNTNRSGRYNYIALDTSDNVHISYVSDVDNYEMLNYATNASGSWVIESVDSTWAIYNSSITSDKSDNVHISYCYNNDDSDTPFALKYATNASGHWVIKMVDSGKDFVGQYSSIAVDKSGKVHISYVGEKGIKYATNATGKWVTEMIETVYLGKNGEFGETSIAIDSFGKAHICYWIGDDLYSATIWYATNASGKWVTKTVDNYSGYYEGLSISLALDMSDKAHISYYGTGRGLYYASNIPGSWMTTIVDNDAGIYSGDTSIVIDTSNKVHVIYYGIGGDLWHAVSIYDSAPWVKTLSAKKVKLTSAMLREKVNPNGSSTTAWFVYGTTQRGPYTNISSTLEVGDETSNKDVSINISGLSAKTKYYYKAVASSSSGTWYGQVKTFTTKSR